MLITKTSQHSGKQHTREIDITEDQLAEIWEKKEVIQKIVPHLSADDREFLITGITPEEWKEIYG